MTGCLLFMKASFLTALSQEKEIAMKLSFFPETYAVCRLASDGEVGDWMWSGNNFLSITRTSQELSIVCEEAFVPDVAQAERGWIVIQVHGPLDFALTGILANLAVPLADAGIPLFAISTFDTDYLLIKTVHREQARRVLESEGHLFV